VRPAKVVADAHEEAAGSATRTQFGTEGLAITGATRRSSAVVVHHSEAVAGDSPATDDSTSGRWGHA
jgi:hypothetical protein